jgi:hypothetical protein
MKCPQSMLRLGILNMLVSVGNMLVSVGNK